MAWIRQLPSKLWAATVYTPAGRITESHEMKGFIAKWASDLEADIRRGGFLDPRLARTSVAQVWERFGGARRLESASRRRDMSMWRNHVAPRWGRIPVGAILKPDVQAWVNEMELAEVGGWTIIASLNVLRTTLELAVDAAMLRSNPALRVKAPIAPKHVDRVIDADEERILLERLDLLLPGRRDARPFVETLLDLGCRWEEAAAIRREAVNLRTGLVSLGPVMERGGRIREYPKGARTPQDAGFRDAPFGDDLFARIRPLVLATAPGDVVFSSPRGARLCYPNWHRQVWARATRIPVLDERGRTVRGEDGQPLWTPLFEDPQPTPHDLRHTYGTRLADAGVEMHDRMALMGQADLRSGQRYTHSGPARFEKAKAAIAAARKPAAGDR